MNLFELIRKGESKTLELKERLPSSVNLVYRKVDVSKTDDYGQKRTISSDYDRLTIEDPG